MWKTEDDFAKFDLAPLFTGHLLPDDTRSKYTKLIEAIRSGDEVLVQGLVNKGAPVNRLFDFPCLSPLHVAVQSRSLEIIRILLDKGANVNAVSWNGETPLILAARIGDPSLIGLLLSHDICNHDDAYKLSHLHVACMGNRVDIVKKLLSANQGKNLNTSVDECSMVYPGYTPLHCAVRFGSVETVDYLLKCGADMMTQDHKKYTPLHLAGYFQNGKIIDLLLSAHKYEVNNPFSSSGLSHFHIACTRDDPSIVQHFLELGVNVNLVTHTWRSKDWEKWRPLHFALYYQCPKVIQVLVQAGAEFDSGFFRIFLAYESVMGNKSIHNLLTIRQSKFYKYFEIKTNAHFLDVKFYIQGQETMTYSYFEIREKNTPCDSYVYNQSGDTALHLAVKFFLENDIKVLMKKGADPLVQNNRGRTPVHLAFYHNNEYLLKKIVENMGEETKNVIDDEGLSIFHILCTTNQLQKVENYLRSGVDVNFQVWNNSEFWAGFTALHFACKYSQAGVVKLLLENHADILIKNRIDLNPFDLFFNKLVLNLISTKYHSPYQNYEIIMAVLQSLPLELKSFNSSHSSLLHAVCACSDTGIELLRGCLIRHPDDINSTINLHRKYSFNNCTPLHLAMTLHNFKKAKVMLDWGADAHVVDSEGRTPLECAFHHNIPHSQSYHHCGPETLVTFEKASQSLRPSHFHIACAFGHVNVVKSVLDMSDEKTQRNFVTFCNVRGQTPLHSVLIHCTNNLTRIQIISLLLENGADVGARDYELRTPLHYSRHLQDDRLLIKSGADTNARDVYGRTPLFRDDNVFETGEVSLLLENGADVNIRDRNGGTCLEKIRLFYLNSYSHEIGDVQKDVVTMLEHVKKLQLIEWFVNKKNEDECGNSRNSFIFKEGPFVSECKKELKLMETVNVNRNTTLRDILSKNLNEMASRCENSDLQQIVYSEDFLSRFPMYGFLVKLHMKNGSVRRHLLDKSGKSFTASTGVFLPQLCLNMISQYLSNEDLENLILSGEKSEVSENGTDSSST